MKACRTFRFIMLAGWWLASGLLVSVIAAWIIGQVASDRWAWSQWLAWTPSPVPVLTMLLLMSLQFLRPCAPRRSRMVAGGGAFIVLIAITFWFAMIEHRFTWTDRTQADGVRIMHWTDNHPSPDEYDRVIDVMIEQDALITILSHPGAITGHQRIRQWLNGNGGSRINGFGIFTRLPILRMERILREDDITLAYAEIDTTEQLGRPTRILLIDLPSDPFRPRAEVAARVRKALDDVAPGIPIADLVVGDANIPRGSWSLRTMFPSFRHAFDLAGHGYGASFHRTFPLLHIDQLLIGPQLEAIDYDLVDPGFGRHRLHAATIRRRPESTLPTRE